MMPNILTPRVAENFVFQIQKVSTNFVWKELTKLKDLKLTKATGLVWYHSKTSGGCGSSYSIADQLGNLTISTGVIPFLSKPLVTT